MTTMDLNSDLGESLGAWTMGDDAAMLEIVSSANVACGFHAGDPVGILQTLRAAAERGVVVGAHVAYPDLKGFGRRNMDISSAELVADVIYQIGALQGGLSRLRARNLLLKVGFTLRCLQRLSLPHFASLLCRWHDNSCTSGASIPVLSY